MAEWHIEPLADGHERGAFSCGKAPLDVFIRTQAGQYARKDVGQTFVAVRPDERTVIGYYTLAASAIGFVQLPANLSKKLPKHPVPTILLGRLAVDTTARGKGLGRDLLADALRRALRIADQVGVFGVHTHAIDDEAKAFYAKFSFVSLLDQERHMFLPMATIRKGLAGTTK
ncbi:MAG TPA: GNAT family N-acetyltransferase [Gemmata sp.]|nr:GNAT family N-acetyltransferase [Gemmata sp.]